MKENTSFARVCPGEAQAAGIMKRTPAQTLISLLARMGVEYVEGLPKDAYLGAFLEEFCQNSRWILRILPEKMLQYLVKIWENETVEIAGEDWESLQYLNIFGFLTLSKGNPLAHEPNVIRYAPDMKQAFYFHLKSKKSRAIMEKYTEWEKVIDGLQHYYGLMEMGEFYGCFCHVMKYQPDYEEFITLLKSRSSLWSTALLLKDRKGEKEYIQFNEVENPEYILLYRGEHENLPYKYPKKEDVIYLSESAGVDNRWEGVAELATFFTEDLKMEYYQTTVLIKTMISMIQNSCEQEELHQKLEVLPFNNEEEKEKVIAAADHLFHSVPIYELKGFCRKEYGKMFSQKELKKKKGMFKIIEGGKRD